MNENGVSLSLGYRDTFPTCANTYLWPFLRNIIAEQGLSSTRVFDLGCGSGATANMLSNLGFDLTGIDLSESGIALGRQNFPHLKLHIGNVYDDLAATFGQFPLVISLEVVEHCFDPKSFAK